MPIESLAQVEDNRLEAIERKFGVVLIRDYTEDKEGNKSPLPADGEEYRVMVRGAHQWRMRRRNRHFVGSLLFPDGIVIGETIFMTSGAGGEPRVPVKGVLDVDPHNYEHIQRLVKGELPFDPAKVMREWNDRRRREVEQRAFGHSSTTATEDSINRMVKDRVDHELTKAKDALRRRGKPRKSRKETPAAYKARLTKWELERAVVDASDPEAEE